MDIDIKIVKLNKYIPKKIIYISHFLHENGSQT